MSPGAPASRLASTVRAAVDWVAEGVLTLLVFATVACSGIWLLIRLLDAGALLMSELSWPAAATAFTALAGLAGVAILALAWRDRARDVHANTSRHPLVLRTIAALATIATLAIAMATRPEPRGFQILLSSARPPVLRVNWWPAVSAALIALTALLLLAKPRSKTPAPQPARDSIHAPIPRTPYEVGAAFATSLRELGSAMRPAFAVGKASGEVARVLSGAAADATALIGQVPSFAARARPGSPARLVTWLLMLAPLACVLVPMALTLVEYGGTDLIFFGTATVMFPPLVVVLVLVLVLYLLCVGALAALPRLWWALLDAGHAAPGWARAFTAIGIPLSLAAAWMLRDSPDHYALGLHLKVGGFHLTPPIVAAFDGVVLLAIHASRRAPDPVPPTRLAPTPNLADHALELVPWQRLTPGERDAVLFLEISAEQIEFAGATVKSVSACEAGDPSEVAGLAIRVGRHVVGWLLLKRDAAAPGWVGPGTAIVGGLRIDQRHQGHGLGSAALAELPRWIAKHWPETSALTLRVDDGNIAGIRAYEKAGWVETGERCIGRVGLERTLTLAL